MSYFEDRYKDKFCVIDAVTYERLRVFVQFHLMEGACLCDDTSLLSALDQAFYSRYDSVSDPAWLQSFCDAVVHFAHLYDHEHDI